jgi:Ca2+-binding RTX toxin-like protein
VRLDGSIEHSDGKVLIGGASSTALIGTDGRDMIDGHGANAVITGGAGADRLVASSGNDTFAYQATTDSTAVAADTITGFQHGTDKIDFGAIAGVTQYQGALAGAGPLTLNAGSIATLEIDGTTLVLANASGEAQTVSAADTHGADMTITLVGVHLGLTADDFQHR